MGYQHNGTGKTAWVIDTGVDLDHPDLNVDQSRSVSFLANEGTDDGYGHGTHVSGIIAALDNSIDVVGVAAGATIVGVKVCNSSGGCFVSDVKAGVEYAANNYSLGDVANLSLGYPTNDPNHPRIDIPLLDMENSIINAANNGLKFTISAGNNSNEANNYSPARIENSNVWTVSAFDINNNFASFSNYGNPPIEYGGPGVNIPSLWKNGGTHTLDGTSMAAPHLAGLLLILGDNLNTAGTVNGDPDSNPDIIPYGALYETTLTQSVQNDYAHFSWQAVAGAEEYDIYYYTNEPAAGVQDFQKITTTTTSSYTGLYLYSSGFGDPDFDRYLAEYYVVARDTNGNFNESRISNYATFNYYRESSGGGGIGL